MVSGQAVEGTRAELSGLKKKRADSCLAVILNALKVAILTSFCAFTRLLKREW
jgi:hypothetical protein